MIENESVFILDNYQSNSNLKFIYDDNIYLDYISISAKKVTSTEKETKTKTLDNKSYIDWENLDNNPKFIEELRKNPKELKTIPYKKIYNNK